MPVGQTQLRIAAFDSDGNKAEHVLTVIRSRDIPRIAFGNFHALVIGIDDYKTLPKLQTALTDAREVARTLETNYGYKVRLLENATRSDIIDALDDFRERLDVEDNLLIYYAGHGWRDEQNGRGYWLPAGAQEDRRSNWFSNASLTDALQAILAKHVMVVADSCYSGTLTRTAKLNARSPVYISRMAEKRARVVLSSGGLEPVADSGGGKHSVFAKQFLQSLRENEGVLDGTQLFEQVRHTVVLNANQTPEYSDIRLAGHEGGDFLFVRKN
ncbi:MAG: caspase family protein [Proteobacteria bacterium]|nr:caspase family protein [Pseudomonadota bacterium]